VLRLIAFCCFLQTAEKNPSVFDHLYENKPKPQFYKVSNRKPTEQRTVEEHCTFRPVINENCPFISERTLRNFAHRERQRRPPSPPSNQERPNSRSPLKRKARDARLTGNAVEEPLSGVYTKQNGFVRCPPPQPNMPIYYFDPIAPPSFESGQYHTGSQSASTEPTATEAYEDVVVTDDETERNDNSLKAPPLPDWAFTTGGPPTAAVAAKKALVIPVRKGPKAEAEAPAATGWQAVLAEMTRKKEEIMNKNNLKKAEPPAEKAAAPAAKQKRGGKKKKAGGGKDFKDVMDELNYKLAKLRGEIVEDDSASEEDSVDAVPVKGKGSAPVGKKAPAAATTEDSEATTPTVCNTPIALSEIDPMSPPPSSSLATPLKKGGISFADDVAGGQAGKDSDENGESPAALPTRKLPSKESMMNLLSKVTKAPPPVPPTEEGGASVSRAKSAPNIAAMLAKRVAPPAEEAPTPAAASSAPAGSAVPSKPATAKPDSIPAPPPVPSGWPPVPHTAVEPDVPPSAKAKQTKTIRKLVTKTSADPTVAGKTTLTEETQELPEGYYMAAPVIGMVRPRHILSGGATSAELCASLKLAFVQAAEAAEALAMEQSAAAAGGAPTTPYVRYDLAQALHGGYASPQTPGMDEYKSDAPYGHDTYYERPKEWNELSPHQHIKERLAVADLPLPPDFHTSVQRMHACNKKREAAVEQERDLELRSFLYYEKSEKSTEPGTPGSGRKLEVTVPVEFVSHTTHHFESKPYSHRKPAAPRPESDDAGLLLTDRIHSAASKVPVSTLPRASTADVVTSYWVSNLRPSVHHTPSSPAPTTIGHRSTMHTTAPTQHAHAHAPSPSLAPPAYKTRTPQKHASGASAHGTPGRASSTSHALAQSFISPIGQIPSFDAASELSSLDEQHMTPGAKYFMNFRPQTQPKAPKLRSDELVNRRQTARKEREERQRLQQAQAEEAERQRKLAMKARAMQAAQEVGAYKSSTRYHQHQKIFEKYSLRPDVGADIEHGAKVAYAQYTTSHHLSGTPGDGLYADALAAACAAQKQRRAAAIAAGRLHQQELSHIQNLQQEYRDYDDDQYGQVDFSPNRRKLLPY
jgi:hypothetical protein